VQAAGERRGAHWTSLAGRRLRGDRGTPPASGGKGAEGGERTQACTKSALKRRAAWLHCLVTMGGVFVCISVPIGARQHKENQGRQAQATRLSRRRQGFKSPWGRQLIPRGYVKTSPDTHRGLAPGVSFEKRLHENAAFFRFQKRSLKHVLLLRSSWDAFVGCSLAIAANHNCLCLSPCFSSFLSAKDSFFDKGEEGAEKRM